MAGGLLTTGAGAAEAAGTGGRVLAARRLKAGDLIVGPSGWVVRVASRVRLGNGRHRIRYTHPHTGEPTPMTDALDETGYPGRRRFVVLLRDVPVPAVTLTPIPQPTEPHVVDGGEP